MKTVCCGMTERLTSKTKQYLVKCSVHVDAAPNVAAAAVGSSSADWCCTFELARNSWRMSGILSDERGPRGDWSST